MTDDIQRAREDISFIKGLISDDGAALARQGVVLLVIGVVFGLNALRLYALDAGWLSWPAALRPLVPWDAFMIVIATLAIVMRRLPRPASGVAARTMASAWTALGIGISVVVASLVAVGWRLQQPTLFIVIFPLVLFTFYGAAWSIAFSAKRRPWFAWIAAGSYATAIAAALLASTPSAWLVLALGLFALSALPGVMLMRQARANG